MHRAAWSHKSKSTPRLREEEKRPSDQSQPGHASRDEAGAVHQVAEDQPVPEGDDEAGAEQERPVLERGERDGEVGRVRGVVPQADDAEHEDDPGRDEDGLDDPRGDVADGEGLVLPPRDRVEDDGGADVREDEQELQERSQVDLVVLPAAAMYPAGSSRTGWKRASAAIEVMNVMMNSTPKIRPCL